MMFFMDTTQQFSHMAKQDLVKLLQCLDRIGMTILAIKTQWVAFLLTTLEAASNLKLVE